MLYKISLDNGFSGEHMGLAFANGKAHTDNIFLASRLQSKGYHVTAEKIAIDETVSDTGEAAEAPPLAEVGGFTPLDFERMKVEQLKKYAAAGDIDLGNARTKADIIATIIAAMSAADVPEAEVE